MKKGYFFSCFLPAKFFSVLLAVLLLNMGCENKLTRKILTDKDLSLTWYDRSISSYVHSFVEFSRDGKTELVMESNCEMITDIIITGKDVVFKFRGDTADIVYEFKKKALGYNLIVDMTSTRNDWYKVYQPEYYNKFSDSANGDTLKKISGKKGGSIL